MQKCAFGMRLYKALPILKQRRGVAFFCSADVVHESVASATQVESVGQATSFLHRLIDVITLSLGRLSTYMRTLSDILEAVCLETVWAHGRLAALWVAAPISSASGNSLLNHIREATIHNLRQMQCVSHYCCRCHYFECKKVLLYIMKPYCVRVSWATSSTLSCAVYSCQVWSGNGECTGRGCCVDLALCMFQVHTAHRSTHARCGQTSVTDTPI
jgi:hypothetical protein